MKPGERLGAIALLLALVLQMGVAAVRDSVTVDEVAHVAVGIASWRAGEFSIDPINPPLPRLLLAIPPLLMGAELERRPELDEWQLGLALMREESGRYHELHVAARVVTILLAVAAAALVFRLATGLRGPAAGLTALALFVFSPSVLAHGHLATVDLAATLGWLAVTAVACTVAERASVRGSALLGAAFGLAIALKLSSATALPVVLGAIAIGLRREPSGIAHRLRAVLGHSAVAGAAALAVVALSYGFELVLIPLAEVRFREGGALSRIAAAVPWLRLPVPAGFLQGIDLLASGNVAGERTFYLAGELSTRGWWSYPFVAYALKTPAPFLAAGALGLLAAPWRGHAPAAERWIAFSAFVVFMANATLNPLNIGVRHVLPAEPLLCILAASALVAALRRSPWLGAVALAVTLAWQAAAALVIAPRYLSYFDLPAGGPARGHEWLVDSNLDWGQDLVRLRELIEERKVESVALAYFGTVHPGVYGIRFTPLVPDSGGLAVISPTLLVGVPSTMWRSFDRWGMSARGEYDWLRARRPIARAGSLFVFDLSSE